ncbi:MAG: hypothetical protein ACK4YP_16060, partial [Myxococcota bacterium]
MILLVLMFGCGEAQQAVEKIRRVAVAAKEEATTPSMPCDAEMDTSPPHNCISGTLRCGETIEGTIVGGDDMWNDDFYAGKFCFPAGDDRSGPERVYLFEAPANTDVELKLQSDCVDLDIAAIAWTYEGT